jgi:hypothetical protein
MRHLLLSFVFLTFTIQLFPQILINEFSSSNLSGITDEDGEYSDWIELHNHTAFDINLEGCHLSDDVLFLSKWTIPAITVKPDSFQVIFASGKNRTEIPLSYQTIIQKGAGWQYLVPATEIGNSWKNNGFDASGWKTGNSGFGFGDDDDATVLDKIVSVYIRKEFTISNLQDVEELFLSVDYDDGFVAYINGQEIARANLGEPGSMVNYNQVTGTAFSREATMYQGGIPETFPIINPTGFLVEGINVIAIEAHNSATGSTDMSLIPMLTLGLNGAEYFDNYPSYIQISRRQLHTNFKISSEGETLILSRPDSIALDSVSPVALQADISYGRKPEGANSWYYFDSPTPGRANTTNGYNSIGGDTVKFSFSGGYFPGGLEIQLSASDPLDSIFYTRDGSEPGMSSTPYTNPILISANTVVRARAMNSQKLPGIISTNTYFTIKHTIPVVCLSTNPENLWDYNTGIYVLGPNAETENPHFGANYWQDWERKAHFELYDTDGNKQVDQDAGIKIFGAWSRANDQKSMALFARKEYGKGSFDYKFFKDKPITKFEALVIRNGGNDWPQAILRDGLTSSLIRDMDMDRMAFQPSIVYLNGEYWGILNIRENVNTNFLAENHFVNPDSINLLEMNGDIINGTNAGYLELLDFLNAHNTLVSEADYQQVSSQIDINNYIQYQLTEIYINNKDWPGNNIKYWNTNDPGSVWRWIIFDTDFGYSLYDNPAYSINTLDYALDPNGPSWPNPPWSTLLFRRMISNPGFRNEFATQYADRINTNFSSDKVNFALDSLKQIFLPEINDHLLRWGMDYNNWLYNIGTIEDYATNRPAYARNHIQDQFSLGVQKSVTVKISTPGAGCVKVNSVIPDTYPFAGIYFKDLPIKLTAIPAPGFKFSRWEGTLNSNSVTIEYGMAANCTFNAIFEPAGITDIKIVINEINYNSSPEKDTKDWVELLNIGSTSVNLKNWDLSDGLPVDGYTFPDDIIVTPGNYMVVCRDMAAFRLIHPEILNSLGDFGFGLGSTGDDINLFDAEGNLVDFVNYTPNAPWPVDANGTGASIELVNPLEDNNVGRFWKSSINGGTPGSLNTNSITLNSKVEILAYASKLECFPNPFRDYTTIRIETPVAGEYKIEVYDLQGKLHNILADQRIESGAYYIDWYGRDSNNDMLPGGVYIIRLSGESVNLNLKVVMIK